MIGRDKAHFECHVIELLVEATHTIMSSIKVKHQTQNSERPGVHIHTNSPNSLEHVFHTSHFLCLIDFFHYISVLYDLYCVYVYHNTRTNNSVNIIFVNKK